MANKYVKVEYVQCVKAYNRRFRANGSEKKFQNRKKKEENSKYTTYHSRQVIGLIKENK
ncbi:hypothetical protein KHA80_12955 [Anaerobacillus sp. HL2]|nr:hypothetical protein KHA80_12955 [Anaerobacillus sp. HL2]